MKIKILLLFFLFLTVSAIFYTFYLYASLKRTTQELVAVKEALVFEKEQNDLRLKEAKSQQLRDSLAVYVPTAPATPSPAPADISVGTNKSSEGTNGKADSPKSAQEKEKPNKQGKNNKPTDKTIPKKGTTLPSKQYVEEKRRALEAELINVEYFIGVYALGNFGDKFKQIVSYLNDKGYSIVVSSELQSPPSWLAKTATVFYYDKASYAFAEQLANTLKSSTGITFDLQMGAGLGVPKGMEQQYFYIHLVEASPATAD